jgi:transcription elongation GreA/GreB family factor
MTVQFEKVGEVVNGHKKIKKHHRRNKQPAWFKEFVDTVFLPTIAEIKATLAEHTALLNQHSKDIAEIKDRLSAVEKRLDLVEARLDRNKII